MRGVSIQWLAPLITGWLIVGCANPTFTGNGRSASGGKNGTGERQDSRNQDAGKNDADATTVIAVGDTANVQDILGRSPNSGKEQSGTRPGAGQDKAKIKSIKSRDPEIATVTPEGTITGKKPGTTMIDVLYDDGSTATIQVTVSAPGGDENNLPPMNPGGTPGGVAGGDSSSPATFFDGGDAGKRGCKIVGDKITWDWPQDIQACFDAKRIWDFTRKTCTEMPLATSYDCSFAGLDSVIMGISSNFTPDWDKSRIKLITCGERFSNIGGIKTHTIAWHYILLPETAKDGDCAYSFNAGIAIGCFESAGFSLQGSSAADLQRCIDGK